MEISSFDIEIKRHALIRAMERNITPDMVEATLRGGKIERFGKNYLRFSKEYKRLTVICIGEIAGMHIKIITIEAKVKS